jgi:hypothetical protein
MPQLTMNVAPGFNDLSDALLVQDAPLTDDILTKISHNAKFGVVRIERIFLGFFKSGDNIFTIAPPFSPVDGYAYAQEEILYDFELVTTRAPGAGFVPGQASPPTLSPNQAANLLYWNYDIDDSTGIVFIDVHYYPPGGQEVNFPDGIVKVYAECQRLSVNVAS